MEKSDIKEIIKDALNGESVEVCEKTGVRMNIQEAVLEEDYETVAEDIAEKITELLNE